MNEIKRRAGQFILTDRDRVYEEIEYYAEGVLRDWEKSAGGLLNRKHVEGYEYAVDFLVPRIIPFLTANAMRYAAFIDESDYAEISPVSQWLIWLADQEIDRWRT